MWSTHGPFGDGYGTGGHKSEGQHHDATCCTSYWEFTPRVFFIPSISWKPNKKGEAHLPLIISPPIFLALKPFLDHLRGVLTSSGLQFYPFRMPAPSRSKGFPVQPPATHPASCHVHRHPPPCQAVSAELRHATRSFRAAFPRCQHDFAGWRHGTWQNLSDFT